MVELILTPTPPFSLAASVGAPDPTRSFADGVLRFVIAPDADPLLCQAWQRPDGTLVTRMEREPTTKELAHVRFVLAVDADHRPFLDLVQDDPLLGSLVSARRGLRPVRTATVAHALLQAVCGQLITAREAKLIEGRILRTIGRRHGGLALPPTVEDLRMLSAADLVRCGLAPRRAAALARVVRTLETERLREVDTARAVARITRERTLGVWSAGMIAMYGLGRFEHGLVGDLGLVRLCSNLLRRPATSEDTQRLVAPYGDWAGLAATHLLRHPLARQRGYPGARPVAA